MSFASNLGLPPVVESGSNHTGAEFICDEPFLMLFPTILQNFFINVKDIHDYFSFLFWSLLRTYLQRTTVYLAISSDCRALICVAVTLLGTAAQTGLVESWQAHSRS